MRKLSRRDFMQRSAAAAAGCAVPLKNKEIVIQDAEKPRVKRYKPFGKTGHVVGDISVGANQRDAALIRYQFDCGINLIDSAYEYPGHEEMIGTIIPEMRKKIFVVSKWDPPLVTSTVTKKELLDALDITLGRLKTTYVDCMMIHAMGSPEFGGMERIQNPAIYEAWDEAKRLGKIRFTGASSHGPRMIEEMDWGIENGRFDVILCGANFLTHGLEPLLQKARAKGVATMAMKTMTLFKSDVSTQVKGLVDKGTNIRQAVLKYVLTSDLFDTVVITMNTFQKVEEYLAVSGVTRLSRADAKTLEVARNAIFTEYCRPGCDGCLGTCPKDVPIANIFRYKMYFKNYGYEKYAMSKYRCLPDSKNGIACSDCSAPCETHCRFNIPIREKLLAAHKLLTFV